jgi:predicted metalloprotease with PDZ domain
MFSSYYTYGAAIALALDLELQTRYHKNIDAYMKAMWKRFGKPEVPYTIPGMQETLASITDAKFAGEFFSRYITGHEPIDYAALLANAGYELKKAQEGKASLGLIANTNAQGKVVVGNSTVRGSAAYEAGLDVNDELLKLDNTEIKSPTDVTSFVQGKKPGDAVTITYRHRNTDKQATAVLKEQPFPMLVDYKASGKPVTAAMQQIRDSWFTSNVK